MPLITGTPGNDVLTGTAGDDEIQGLAGDDLVDSGSGADLVDGGEGDDVLRASSVSVGFPPTRFDGGTGKDTFDFSAVQIGPHAFWQYHTTNSELSVANYIIRNTETLIGSSGRDIFNFAQVPFDLTIYGGAGDDLLSAGGGSDKLYGGSGNDVISDQFGGTNYFYGEDGDDTFEGNAVVIDGGAGDDTYRAPFGSGVVIDLTSSQFVSVENVSVSGPANYSVTAFGTEEANRLVATHWIVNGEGTAVTFNGRGGNDILTGAGGADRLNGDDGDDVLTGGGGADTLFGGDDNDVIHLEIDDISGNGGNGDDLFVLASTFTRSPGPSINGDSGNDTVFAQNIATLSGNLGFLSSTSYPGYIVITEILGDSARLLGIEVIYGSLVARNSFSFSNNVGPMELHGGGQADQMYGSSANADVMYGNGGNDDFLINAGDTAYGGDGNDRFFVGFNGSGHFNGENGIDEIASGQGYVIDLAAGTATYFTLSNFTFTGIENASMAVADGVVSTILGDTNNNLLFVYSGNPSNAGYGYIDGRDGNDTLTGSAWEDTLIGGAGDDYLDGGGRADVMSGGIGNDSYVVDDAGDVINEAAMEGFDEILTSLAAFSLHANVENLTGTNITGQSLTGNDGANQILGNAGNDWLNGGLDDDSLYGGGGNDQINAGAGNDYLSGGSGADTMDGGAGNDTFIVDDIGDVIEEAVGHGYDAVYSNTSSPYILSAGAEVELLATYGTGNIDLYGNEFSQTIVGGDGNNYISGRGGADLMRGLGGNDTYIADSVDDYAFESVNGGYDAVYTNTTHILYPGSEIELLATYGVAGNIDLYGNEFAQSIYGSAGNNYISGGGGADSMRGLGGDDTYVVDVTNDLVLENAGQGIDAVYSSSSYALYAGSEVEVLGGLGTGNIDLYGNEFGQSIYGNAGNNYISGGGGADSMRGFGGDDTYVVDVTNDLVLENAGQGIDAVYSSSSYALYAGSEVEVLGGLGTGNIDLYGNEFGQSIYGNAGNNYISGGGGTDTMRGLGGNDNYIVDGSSDLVFEDAGAGYDVVYANTSFALTAGSEVEVLSAYSDGPLALQGNEFGQGIYGGNGNDVLRGNGGNDTIIGNGGTDIAEFAGLKSSYTVTFNAGVYTVVDNDASADGNDGTDTVYSVETLRFKNGETFSAGTSTLKAETSQQLMQMSQDMASFGSGGSAGFMRDQHQFNSGPLLMMIS